MSNRFSRFGRARVVASVMAALVIAGCAGTTEDGTAEGSTMARTASETPSPATASASPPATATTPSATASSATTSPATVSSATVSPTAAVATSTAARSAPTEASESITTRSTTTEAEPPADPFPFEVATASATQVITVAVPDRSATQGTLTAWQRYDTGWKVTYGPIPAFVGESGIGDQHEGSALTPEGTFELTEAFGALPDPGTALPYFATDDNDWWVSDVDAETYNTHQRCDPADCPFDTGVSERLGRIVPQYNYAVVMDVNRYPVVPGKGSAFFLHVTDGVPTAGCVAVTQDHLLALMGWLRPGARIAVGVG